MNKIAMLFPGQGSQYSGMGRKLSTKYSIVQKTFEEANEVLGFDLQKICFEGSEVELAKTEITQPAILTVSVAQFRAYMQQFEKEPVVLAGHSLGEITAITCAGGISFQDALKIVRKRGSLMQSSVQKDLGAMAAIRDISSQIIEEACINASVNDLIVTISNYNSQNEVVISGHKIAVNNVCERLANEGGKITFLKVSAPFHSPLMESVAREFRSELSNYSFNNLKWDVISNVTGLPYNKKEQIIDNLTNQITAPVQWEKSMKYIKSQKVDLAIELGPKRVLKNLTKTNIPELKVFAFDNENDLNDLEKIYSYSKTENSNMVYEESVVSRCIAIAVCTKNSNWNNEEYEKGVIQPYKRLQEIQKEVEVGSTTPNISQCRQALDLLKTILITKKVSNEEIKERFNQILSETNTVNIFNEFKEVL